MSWIVTRWTRLRKRFALTPEQAEQLANIKFPCC